MASPQDLFLPFSHMTHVDGPWALLNHTVHGKPPQQSHLLGPSPLSKGPLTRFHFRVFLSSPHLIPSLSALPLLHTHLTTPYFLLDPYSLYFPLLLQDITADENHGTHMLPNSSCLITAKDHSLFSIFPHLIHSTDVLLSNSKPFASAPDKWPC